MRKSEEIKDENSCLNRAKDDEMLFVIRGHDPAAQAAILAWIEKRISLGKNTLEESQIEDAFRCAQIMETDRKAVRK